LRSKQVVIGVVVKDLKDHPEERHMNRENSRRVHCRGGRRRPGRFCSGDDPITSAARSVGVVAWPAPMLPSASARRSSSLRGPRCWLPFWWWRQ
jgi:hypothetical protein